MMIVVDTSVLVAELVRPRGRALILDSRLEILATQEQLGETRHELNRRLRRVVDAGRIGLGEADSIRYETERIFIANAIRAGIRIVTTASNPSPGDAFPAIPTIG